MKKRVLMISIVLLMIFAMSSCAVMNDPYFQEGFRQGWNATCPPGYEY